MSESFVQIFSTPIQFDMNQLLNQKAVDQLAGDSQHTLNNITQITFGDLSVLGEQNIQNDIQNIDVIDRCKGLQELNLVNTQISSLNNFKIIRKIEKFVIKGCNKITNFDFVKKCDKVKELFLGDMNITNVDMLPNMKSLQHLNLYNTINISDFNALSKCVNLKQLYLNNTSITDISPIICLDNLSLLHIDDNYYLDCNFRKNQYSREYVVKYFEMWKQTPKYKAYLANKNNKSEKTQVIDSAESLFEKALQEKIQQLDETIKNENKELQDEFQAQFDQIYNEIKQQNDQQTQLQSQILQQLNEFQQQTDTQTKYQTQIQQFQAFINDMKKSANITKNDFHIKQETTEQWFISVSNAIVSDE